MPVSFNVLLNSYRIKYIEIIFLIAHHNQSLGQTLCDLHQANPLLRRFRLMRQVSGSFNCEKYLVSLKVNLFSIILSLTVTGKLQILPKVPIFKG